MANLTFDETSHIYQIDGGQVPSVTQICGLLTAEKYGNGGAMLGQAKRRGSAVHEYCELIDYGAEPDEIEPELLGYITAYLRFVRDYRPIWTHIEHRTAHTLLKYAGTVDRIGCIDGKQTIVDWKTTANMDRVSKISLACQLSGYDMALMDNGFPQAEQLWGVQLKRNGTYTIQDQAKIEDKYKFNSRMTFLDLLSIKKLIGG